MKWKSSSFEGLKFGILKFFRMVFLVIIYKTENYPNWKQYEIFVLMRKIGIIVIKNGKIRFPEGLPF